MLKTLKKQVKKGEQHESNMNKNAINSSKKEVKKTLKNRNICLNTIRMLIKKKIKIIDNGRLCIKLVSKMI